MNLTENSFSCIYGPLSTGFSFYPRNGVWTMRSVYEIMLECEKVDVLKGVFPCPVSEGGFAWKGTPESTAEWYRNTNCKNYDPSKIADREIRTYGVGSFWVEDKNNWKDWMPQDPKFNEPMWMDPGNTYSKGKEEIKAISCRCKVNPTVKMCVELMKIIRNQGHTILSTEGFKINNNDQIVITPGKENKIATAGEIRSLRSLNYSIMV